MASNQRLQPLFQDANALPSLPPGWEWKQFQDLAAPQSVGRKYENKTVSPEGKVPVIDQSADGVIGYHNDTPGVEASPLDPVFTFANHTCVMRWMAHPFSCIQNVFVFRAKSGVHLRYLFYAAFGRVVLEEYKGHAPVFRAMYLPLAPKYDQRAIAQLLNILDARIDLLRQTNATLEAIAQTLFKSWFIDFDPVRVKAEGREPEGMDTATAALFPSEFEESALGLIPKGWTVRSLDSFATYLNGLALQKHPAESEDEYLPVIKIAQLRAGHTSGSDRASARLKPEYVVRDGDVLFSWSGSLEVEFWCGGEGALNQHLFKVTSSEVPKWFYYLATKHFLPGFREIAAHKATTMGHIQRGHLTESRLALPPALVMQVLSSVMGPLLERRIHGALQARELAAVRDALLPRLISGRLRLPESIEAAEAAAA